MIQYNKRFIKQKMKDLFIELDDFNKIKQAACFNKRSNMTNCYQSDNPFMKIQDNQEGTSQSNPSHQPGRPLCTYMEFLPEQQPKDNSMLQIMILDGIMVRSDKKQQYWTPIQTSEYLNRNCWVFKGKRCCHRCKR